MVPLLLTIAGPFGFMRDIGVPTGLSRPHYVRGQNGMLYSPEVSADADALGYYSKPQGLSGASCPTHGSSGYVEAAAVIPGGFGYSCFPACREENNGTQSCPQGPPGSATASCHAFFLDHRTRSLCAISCQNNSDCQSGAQCMRTEGNRSFCLYPRSFYKAPSSLARCSWADEAVATPDGQAHDRYMACLPSCDDSFGCPAAPAGVFAKPTCVHLRDNTLVGAWGCLLNCTVNGSASDAACPTGATCVVDAGTNLSACFYPAFNHALTWLYSVIVLVGCVALLVFLMSQGRKCCRRLQQRRWLLQARATARRAQASLARRPAGYQPTECSICLDREVSTRSRRCGHSAMCVDCADRILAQERPCCPFCREPFARADIEIGVFPVSFRSDSQGGVSLQTTPNHNRNP